jgi:hypothetical protein
MTSNAGTQASARPLGWHDTCPHETRACERECRNGCKLANASAGVQPSAEVQALLLKLWLAGGGNPAITEPTEQNVFDQMAGFKTLLDAYEREDAERNAGVKTDGEER